MCMRLKEHNFFVAPFSRLLVREASPYLSCSLSITMRNVELRPARGSTRVLPVCNNKKKEPRQSRESEEEGSGAAWRRWGYRRRKEKGRDGVEEKRKTSRAKNEVKRDQNKKKKVRKGEENIKHTQGTWCNERPD